MPKAIPRSQVTLRQHVEQALLAAETALQPPPPEGIHIPRAPRPVMRRENVSAAADSAIDSLKSNFANATTSQEIFRLAHSAETFAKGFMDPSDAETIQKYTAAFSGKLQDLNSGYRAYLEQHMDTDELVQYRQQMLRKHINAAGETAQRAYNVSIKQSMQVLIRGSHDTKDFTAAHNAADEFLKNNPSVSALKGAATAHDARAALGQMRDNIRTLEGSQTKMLLKVYADIFEKTLKDINPDFAAISNARKK